MIAAAFAGNLFWAVVGAAIGVVLGGVVERSRQRWRLYRTAWRAAKTHAAGHVEYDPSDRWFELQSWNADLRSVLRPVDVGPTLTVDAPSSDWFTDRTAWTRALRSAIEEHGLGGPTAYLVGATLDNPEVRGIPDRQRKFCWRVARSDYAEFIATSNYLQKMGDEERSSIRKRLEDDWHRALGSSPPTIIACNISLASADGRLLAIRRSQATATSRGLWMLGAHETMNWIGQTEHPLGGGGPETAFSLAHRSLREEIGLEPHEYGPILFSWFGIYLVDISTYIFGHVRSRLTSSEINDRISKAEASYEHARSGHDVAWLPYRPDMLQTIVSAAEGRESDPDGRSWLPHSALSAVGLSRMAPLLRRDPDLYFTLGPELNGS